jgi:hypothetical protein
MYIWMAEGLLTEVSILTRIPFPAGSSPGSENFSILIPVRPLNAAWQMRRKDEGIISTIFYDEKRQINMCHRR